MDKTTSFFGGIIAGAIGLGVASWYFAEYLPTKRAERERLARIDADLDEQDTDFEKGSDEDFDKTESVSEEVQTSDTDAQTDEQDNINSSAPNTGLS